MKKQQFPKGWDEKRLKQLIVELDARTDEDWVAADEAAAADADDPTVITVPTARLPEIRRLLTRTSSRNKWWTTSSTSEQIQVGGAGCIR